MLGKKIQKMSFFVLHPRQCNLRNCGLKADLNENELIKFCKKQEIDLVIIGPEQFLEDGLSDYKIKKVYPFLVLVKKRLSSNHRSLLQKDF